MKERGKHCNQPGKRPEQPWESVPESATAFTELTPATLQGPHTLLPGGPSPCLVFVDLPLLLETTTSNKLLLLLSFHIS